MLEKRIDELEIRMAHLENYLKQLNEVVLADSRLIEALKTDQTALRRQIIDMSEQLPGPESTKPPHY